MARLRDVTKLIRTKNAGPFSLTIDVMFDDPAAYRAVQAAGVLEASVIGAIYKLPPEKVRVYYYDPANAIKITIPRPVISGDVGDSDVFGGQQYGPLVDLAVPAYQTTPDGPRKEADHD